MLQNAPQLTATPRAGHHSISKGLLDMDNQIGNDAALVKALRWAVVRQSEDALAATPPRLLLSNGTENERNRFP
jgi:hypothetical protein